MIMIIMIQGLFWIGRKGWDMQREFLYDYS